MGQSSVMDINLRDGLKGVHAVLSDKEKEFLENTVLKILSDGNQQRSPRQLSHWAYICDRVGEKLKDSTIQTLNGHLEDYGIHKLVDYAVTILEDRKLVGVNNESSSLSYYLVNQPSY
ncbi:MAG: hypothetical protein V1831_03800 [Candidatus Woesearchaeota archaeon]